MEENLVQAWRKLTGAGDTSTAHIDRAAGSPAGQRYVLMEVGVEIKAVCIGKGREDNSGSQG